MTGETIPGCPFPGLRPFRRGEDALFFGRDREIANLRSALLGEHRFVAVVGTSGCGKSSLVEAGLLPRLMAESAPGGHPWRVISLRPLGSPIAQLAEALATFARAEQPGIFGDLHGTVLASRFRATLRRTTDGLKDAILEVLADADTPVLVFVDQFEELFRYEPDEADQDLPLFRDEAQTFTNLLLAATRAAEPPIHVLITMRSDFFGECGSYLGLAEAVSRSHFLVPRMVREQLQEAITGPICVHAGIPRERWQEVLEPALLQRLLNAVGDSATADPLPVMQHALMRAWQNAAHGTHDGAVPVLRVSNYVAAGEVAEALSRHADEVLARAVAAAGPALPPDGPAHLFRALTDIDREGRAIRRPQTLAELAPVVGAPMAALVVVLDAFRAPGVSFLTPYSPVPVEEATPIDISHEALIRRWARIADPTIDPATGEARGWLQQEFRDGLTWRALSVQAEVFGHNPEACLDPATTEQRYPWFRRLRRRPAWALRYAIDPKPDAAPEDAPEWVALRALLLSSLRRKRDGRRALKAAAREADQRTAVARRALKYAYAVGAVLLILSGTAGWGFYSATVSSRQERLTRVQALIALSNSARSLGQTQDALKLALAAWPRWDGDGLPGRPDVLEALRRSIREQIEAVPPMQHDQPVGGVAFRPDGKVMLTAVANGPAQLWDAQTGRVIGNLMGAEGRSLAANFTIDGKRVLTATPTGAQLWNSFTAEPIGSIMQQRDRLRSAVLAATGTRLLTTTATEAQLWDAQTGAAVGAPMPHQGITPATIDGSGTRVVTTVRGGGTVLWTESNGALDQVLFDRGALQDGAPRLWNTAQEQRSGKGIPQRSVATRVAFSSDGTRILTITGRTVRQWNTVDGAAISAMLHDKDVLIAGYSPDNSRILTASGGDVRQWNAVDGAAIEPAMHHDDEVLSALYRGDGKLIATTARNNEVRLWTAADGVPINRPMRHEGTITSMSFSGDGATLATASRDRRARLWATSTAEPIGPSIWHQADVNGVALSPDGTQVLTASSDKTARLWNVPKGRLVGEPMQHGSKVWSAAFDKAGMRVVTASWDGSARVWDAQNGRVLVRIGENQEKHFNSAAFSPDGRLIATGSQDGTVRLWNAADGASAGLPMQHAKEVWTVEFNRDGTRLLTASSDSTAVIWDVAMGTRIKVLTHDDIVSSATFDGPARRVATSSDDGTVRLWDAETGQEIARLPRNDRRANSAAFSPDGALLAIASAEEVSIWDTIKQVPVGVRLQHDAEVASVAFSADGMRLVTASFDRTARVWDAFTGAQIGQPMPHDGEVYSAAFNNEASAVVTASEDRSARIWKIDEPSALIPMIACGLLPERKVRQPVVDLKDLGKRYGFPLNEPICETDPPLPDWIERPPPAGTGPGRGQSSLPPRAAAR